MAKLSKKRKQMAEKLEAGKSYSIEEAVALITEFASSKFSESLDVSVNLGVDARKSDVGRKGSVNPRVPARENDRHAAGGVRCRG